MKAPDSMEDSEDSDARNENIRVISYNVKMGQNFNRCDRCVGNTYDPQRQADALARYKPDILCLQEVEINPSDGPPVRTRSIASYHNDDQVAIFKDRLGFEYTYFQPGKVEKHKPGVPLLGTAILSKYELLDVEPIRCKPVTMCCGLFEGRFEQFNLACRINPRTKDSEGTGDVWIVCAHLACDLTGVITKSQAEDIVEFINGKGIQDETLIIGDMNSPTFYSAISTLRNSFSSSGSWCRGSFPSSNCYAFPLCFAGCFNLDYCFTGTNIHVNRDEFLELGPLSDHKPLLVEFAKENIRCVEL